MIIADKHSSLLLYKLLIHSLCISCVSPPVCACESVFSSRNVPKVAFSSNDVDRGSEKSPRRRSTSGSLFIHLLTLLKVVTNLNMMPSLNSGTTAIDAMHLCDVLRGLRPSETLPVLLDCRDESSYTVSHIRGAVHVALPSLLVRRLAAGKASIGQVAKHLGADVHGGVLLYDNDGEPTPVVVALANRMLQEGCAVHYLAGKTHK